MKSNVLWAIAFLLAFPVIPSYSQDKLLKGQDCYVNPLDVPYVRVYADFDPEAYHRGTLIGYLPPLARYRVLDESEGKAIWLKIKAADGLEGWIPRWHMICPAYESRYGWARVSRIRWEDVCSAPAGIGPIFLLATSFYTSIEGFLRAEARRQASLNAGKETSEPSSSFLTRGEQKTWRKCIAFYDDAPELVTDYFWAPPGVLDYYDAVRKYLPSGSKRLEILEQAAPIYRKYWWYQHRQAGVAWIGTITPWLDRMSNSIADQIAKAFEIHWPRRQFTVIVRPEYGPRNVFLTNSENVIVALTSDPECQGFSAIELLFREASRKWAGEIDTRAKEAAIKIGRKVPKEFVEILLSYTAGELTRRELEKAGVKDYRPLATRNPATASTEIIQALDKHWRAHLDGRESYEGALKSILSESQ